MVIEAAAGRAMVMAGTGSNADGRGDPADAVRRPGRGRWRAARWLPIITGRIRKGCTATSRRSPSASICRWSSTTSRRGPAGTSSPRRSNGWPKLGPIVAVKEASGSLDQVSELLARTDLTILSGDDSLTLPMLAVGAEGVVSVVGNLVPRT